jgi:hypothetical protein
MTSREVEELRRRVQDRAALYTTGEVDPIKMECLLDEVNVALRHLLVILHLGVRENHDDG